MTNRPGHAPRPLVSVYGSSLTPGDSPLYHDAVELGRRLAQRGADIACGGYGGVMEAVSAGTREGGGAAIGYTVKEWNMRQANGFLSIDRPCADLYERLRCLIEPVDALIALGGGIGTLVEVALAWNHLCMRLIADRPLILVGLQWRSAIDGLRDLLELSDTHLELLTFCSDIDETIACLQSKGIIR